MFACRYDMVRRKTKQLTFSKCRDRSLVHTKHVWSWLIWNAYFLHQAVGQRLRRDKWLLNDTSVQKDNSLMSVYWVQALLLLHTLWLCCHIPDSTVYPFPTLSSLHIFTAWSSWSLAWIRDTCGSRETRLPPIPSKTRNAMTQSRRIQEWSEIRWSGHWVKSPSLSPRP